MFNGFCINFFKVLREQNYKPEQDITLKLPTQHFTKEMKINEKHCFNFLTIDNTTKFCRIFIVVDNNFSIEQVLYNINSIYQSLENMLNIHWAFGKYTDDGWVPAYVSNMNVYKFMIDENFFYKVKVCLLEKNVKEINEQELNKQLHKTGRYLNTKKYWKQFEKEFNNYFLKYQHDKIQV